MAHRILKVKERGVSIKLISCADDGNIRTPLPLKGKGKREMSFIDPGSLVCYSFSFESAELQCNICRVFHDHVWSRGCASHILKVLPHETITTTWVGSIHDSHLFLAISGCVASLGTEMQVFFSFITIDIFWSQQCEVLVHMDYFVGRIENMAALR